MSDIDRGSTRSAAVNFFAAAEVRTPGHPLPKPTLYQLGHHMVDTFGVYSTSIIYVCLSFRDIRRFMTRGGKVASKCRPREIDGQWGPSR